MDVQLIRKKKRSVVVLRKNLVPYSTEITPTPEIKPTPTFDWKFLHRLICFDNTPTRK